ncbi:MAG: hypothetical protein FIB07_13270 [Candidatus Methanoperedens sp.]|nr:hypothetical protein [Candidatus Methanoperedens sp.]
MIIVVIKVHKLKYYISGLTVMVILMFLIGSVYAQGMSTDGTEDESSLILYFHIAQVIIAIIVAKFVIDVIEATGQKDVFIFIPIAMGIFIVSAVIRYLPHLSNFSEADAELYNLILNSLAMVSMGVSFYKWRKMLIST